MEAWVDYLGSYNSNLSSKNAATIIQPRNWRVLRVCTYHVRGLLTRPGLCLACGLCNGRLTPDWTVSFVWRCLPRVISRVLTNCDLDVLLFSRGIERYRVKPRPKYKLDIWPVIDSAIVFYIFGDPVANNNGIVAARVRSVFNNSAIGKFAVFHCTDCSLMEIKHEVFIV